MWFTVHGLTSHKSYLICSEAWLRDFFFQAIDVFLVFRLFTLLVSETFTIFCLYMYSTLSVWERFTHFFFFERIYSLSLLVCFTKTYSLCVIYFLTWSPPQFNILLLTFPYFITVSLLTPPFSFTNIVPIFFLLMKTKVSRLLWNRGSISYFLSLLSHYFVSWFGMFHINSFIIVGHGQSLIPLCSWE